MLTFDELYKKVAESSKTKVVDEELKKLKYDPYHLECVLKPELTRPRWIESNENCNSNFIDCLYKSLVKDGNTYTIEYKSEKCRQCIDENNAKKILASKDAMAVLDAIKDGTRPVYAAIAPAFLSQFDVVNDGQLRTAFKQIGFAGMIEVSLFADILTLKEALEFDTKILEEGDYMLTSCCCPMWVNLIRVLHPEYLEHVPKAVSPMVAAGRVIKKLVPNAFTVFIGPCLAKKSEAKDADIKDAIDVVLTFQEIKDIFNAAKISDKNLPVDLREHSSAGGRNYAVTSGVSKALDATLNKLDPNKRIKVKAVQANGILECKELMKKLQEGQISANFIEGMGCIGGCVGGPKSLIGKDEATKKVNEYVDKAIYKTPLDNPYIVELLYRINIKTVEELLEDHEIFTRYF
jgi:iron only hydrogenase large subunit-like protein